MSVRGTVTAGVYVNRIRNLQVISITVADTTGRLAVWFNAPLSEKHSEKGSCFIFVRKSQEKGHLEMEHPEIFTPQLMKKSFTACSPYTDLLQGLQTN